MLAQSSNYYKITLNFQYFYFFTSTLKNAIKELNFKKSFIFTIWTQVAIKNVRIIKFKMEIERTKFKKQGP